MTSAVVMREKMCMQVTVLFLAALLSPAVVTASSPPKLNCMAVMFGIPDWGLGFNGRGANQSACIEQVDRAAERCSKAGIKINPYFFYSWALPADAKPGDTKDYRHSVTGWLYRNEQYTQVPATQAAVEGYVAGLGACMAHAVSKGFKEIYVSPMLDADYNQGPECCPYRNVAEFNPLTLLPGVNGTKWSYESFVIQPSLRAMLGVQQTNPGVKWRFSLATEQGRSFVTSAAAWQTLAASIRTTLGQPKKSKLRVGPNFNWAGICGQWCGNYGPTQTGITQAQFAVFLAFLLSPSVDFYGISNYPNVWDSYDPVKKKLDHLHAIRTLDTEFTLYTTVNRTFNLTNLRKAGKEFILNEVGLGGCKNFGCDGTNTPDIYDMAIASNNGIGQIETFTDPKSITNPFRYAWQKAFRMEWYRQFLQQFRQGMGPYKPSVAYQWMVGSWDIHGLYAASFVGFDVSVGCNPKKVFCDPEAVNLTARYNAGSTSVLRNPFFNLPGPDYYQKPSF